MSSNRGLILYNYWRSSSSYRVRIALKLKNLDYEYRPVHLINQGGEQNQDAFRRLNPKGEVPLLVDGDFYIGQSLAILDYLENKWPEPALLPKDFETRARCIQLCEIINSGMQPLHNLRVLQKLEKEAGYTEEKKKVWIQDWIHQGFKAIEDLIASSAKEFCMGTRVSWADICLVPQVYSAKRFGVELANYPRIAKINDHCLKIQAFADSAPEKQIDAQS